MNEASCSVDNDPVYDYSHSTDVGRVTTFQKVKKKCHEKLTLKNLSFQQYRILIYATIFCNALSLIAEGCYLVQLQDRHDFSETYYSVIPWVVTILSGLNVCLLLKLTQRPTTQATLGALAIMLCLIIAYVIQACIHYIGVYTSALEISFVVIFIIIQLFSAIMLYRFWEMILYNYDSSTVSGSQRNSFMSYDARTAENLEGSQNVLVTSTLSNSINGSGSLQLKKALTSAAHMQDQQLESVV